MLVNVNIGHQHPKVVEAIETQARHHRQVAPAHATNVRALAGPKDLDHAPGTFTKCSSPTEVPSAQRETRSHGARSRGPRRRSSRSIARITATPVGPLSRRATAPLFPTSIREDTFTSSAAPSPPEYSVDHSGNGNSSAPCTTSSVSSKPKGPNQIAAFSHRDGPRRCRNPDSAARIPQGSSSSRRQYGIVLILDEVMAGFGGTGE